MKTRYFILTALVAIAAFMGSCKKEEPSIHTNASLAFSEKMTFVGTAYAYGNDSVPYTDENAVTITIERYPADSLQAVMFHFDCAKFGTGSMNQDALFNVVSTGSNRYLFSSGSNASKTTATEVANGKSNGVLENDILTMKLSLTKAGKFTLGDNQVKAPYTFILKKQ